MNVYPVGSVVVCRFCFTKTALSEAQLEAFLEGRGLPASVTPESVSKAFLDYEEPEGALTTLTGAELTQDGIGQYHGVITTKTPGLYRYRGRGVNGSGEPIAATADYYFKASRSF